MIFFKKRKERKEKSLKTKELMKKLFTDNVSDNDGYKLIYAYYSYLTKKNNIEDYYYDSMVVGYRESDMSIIVLNTNKEFTTVFKNTKYIKDKIEKASYSPSKDLYTIYKTNKKSLISFTPIAKNFDDGDILAVIEQEDELEDFKDFFGDFKKKSHRRQK